MDTLKEFFFRELCELLGAAEGFSNTFNRMKSAVTGKDVNQLLETYSDQCQYQSRVLKEYLKEVVFEAPQSHPLIQSLKDEAKRFVSFEGSSHIRDLAVLYITQKIKHYEIASFETLLILAKDLGLEEEIDMLEALRIKVGVEDNETHELIKNTLQSAHRDHFEEECIQLLGAVIYHKVEEEKSFKEVLESLKEQCNSSPLSESVLRMLQKRDEVIHLLHSIQDDLNYEHQTYEFTSAKAISKQVRISIQPLIKSKIKDAAIRSFLHKVHQMDIGESELLSFMIDYLEREEWKIVLNKLKAIEITEDQTLFQV
ncbi:MAG: hypothetical protein Tsb0021_15540 [Chlamydiales bacterium]